MLRQRTCIIIHAVAVIAALIALGRWYLLVGDPVLLLMLPVFTASAFIEANGFAHSTHSLWIASVFFSICLGLIGVSILKRKEFSQGFQTLFSIWIIACVLTWFGYRYYTHTPDWTSRGLNPEALEFKPSVLTMAGNGYYNGRAGYFELIIRGTNYFEKWRNGPYLEVGTWERITGSLCGYDWRGFMILTPRGTHGGGAVGSAGYGHSFFPGSHLFKGDLLVGVGSVRTIEAENWEEQDSYVRQFGPYRIPLTIEITSRNHSESLNVKRVEFSNSPSFGELREMTKRVNYIWDDSKPEFNRIDALPP